MKHKIAILFLLLIANLSLAQNQAIDLDSVRVVGLTPLYRTGLPKSKITTNVQQLTNKQLQNQTLTDAMNQQLGSVHINEPNGSPLQPNVSFRGFQASPLLGTPQGISVYQDGVRLNELFGDVVNWDMVPRTAIAGLELVSGSNPMFGLNTLGGTLSLQMKNGFKNQGLLASMYGGSFGRLNTELSLGHKINDRWAFFGTVQHFQERGWRDFSPSAASLGYGKLSYQTPKTNLDISLTLGKSNLLGNGPLPETMLTLRRQSVYTHPDRTENGLALLNVQGSHKLANHLTVNGLVYYKSKKTTTLNGDTSPYEDEDGFLELDDEPVFDTSGKPIIATASVLGGTNNHTLTNQNTYGGMVQIIYDKPLNKKENLLILGASFDGGTALFNSKTELASLTEDRGTVGSGVVDGHSLVDVHIKAKNASVFVMENLNLTDQLTVNMSARANFATIVLEDQIDDDLNGDHSFFHLNPSAGIVYEMSKKLNAYANYSISNRTPTPVELTCADPDAPCRLPNSFLSDPPLKQVVANTAEVGLRGQWRNWEATTSLFQTNLKDDIYFISAGASRNSGYFTNIGSTVRKGIEISLIKSKGAVRGFLNYTFLDARFKDEMTISSPFNPEAVQGEIEVEAGSQMPLIPRHFFKIGFETDIKKLTIGLDFVTNGSQFLRGDEGNYLAPLPAYSFVNARFSYRLTDRWVAFGRVNNLLNQQYNTFGLLGEVRNLPNVPQTNGNLFLTPAAPMSVMVGINFSILKK